MARAARTPAKPSAPPTQQETKQATNVMAMLDVVGALSAGTLERNLYLFDNNRWAGSTGHGSASLTTVAGDGDMVVWTTTTLECEAFARLQLVEIDMVYADYIDLDAATFDETPEVYWLARILKPLPADGVPYRLSYRLGSANLPYRAPRESRLIPPAGMAGPPLALPQEQTPEQEQALDLTTGDAQ